MSTGNSQIDVQPVTLPYQHGEAPHWDNENGILYFVDTFQATVLKWDPYTGVKEYKLENFDSIAVAIPIKNRIDELLVAADRSMMILNWGNDNTGSTTLKGLGSVEKHKERNQFNDGKADSKGNLWIGTLTRRKDLGVDPSGGSLYMVDFNKKDFLIFEKITGVSISNGLVWSKDDKNFYYIDSETRYVVRYDFDLTTGTISDRKIIFDLRNHPEFHGIPDGMTIDSEDNIWVALFGGGCILRIDPTRGALVTSVKLPVTYVTSMTFGGPQLDVLYVTTSRLKLTAQEAMTEPLAGCVFAISGLGASGLPEKKVVID